MVTPENYFAVATASALHGSGSARVRIVDVTNSARDKDLYKMSSSTNGFRERHVCGLVRVGKSTFGASSG
jgi:hypothetical protein